VDLGVGAGVGFGVGFGGLTVGAGVGGPDVGRGVAIGVAAGVAAGDRVGAAVGRVCCVGLGRSTTAIPPLGDGAGSAELEGLGDGADDTLGLDDGNVPGLEIGSDSEGASGEAPVSTVLGLAIAMPSPGTRGAPIPTARATVARTRLRTPRATTSRARWADVTSLLISFRRALLGGPHPADVRMVAPSQALGPALPGPRQG
jgi:hypothetical protein